MLTTNYNGKNLFRDFFTNNLSMSSHLSIASGYFGKSEIDRHYTDLVDLARNGGDVKIVHGMAGSEGLSPILKSKLESLHKDLKKVSNTSAIFISKNRYHGKLYLFDQGVKKNVSIGSSNFSLSGFETNIEMNIHATDEILFTKAQKFFDDLLNDSIEIDKFKLPQRGGKRTPQTLTTTIPANIQSQPISYTIPLRAQPKSSLNLFLSAGRINRSTGVYTPRPFYEVELTIPRKYWVAPLTNFVTNQIVKQEFDAITDTGDTFKVIFKRKTSKEGDFRGIHDCGGDFMSSPREKLGIYIKNKLMQAGLLRFGEPITDDILDAYSSNHLQVIDMGGQKLFIKF